MTEVSAKAGVTTFSKQQVVLASGQPEVFTPAAFTTPTNTIAENELVLDKAKRRAAIRNLDNPAGTSSPGYLFNYALAPYMSYPSEVFFAGQTCSGISFLGIGGQGFFLPGRIGGGLISRAILILDHNISRKSSFNTGWCFASILKRRGHLVPVHDTDPFSTSRRLGPVLIK